MCLFTCSSCVCMYLEHIDIQLVLFCNVCLFSECPLTLAAERGFSELTQVLLSRY